MKAWIGTRKEPPKFEAPGNIVFVSVDRGSGNPVVEGTPGAITESFIAGTQPGGFASHPRLALGLARFSALAAAHWLVATLLVVSPRRPAPACPTPSSSGRS